MAYPLRPSLPDVPLFRVAAAAVIVSVTYCAITAVVGARTFSLAPAVGWALAGVIPLALASLALHAVRQQQLPLFERACGWALITAGALLLSLALSYWNAVWHFGSVDGDAAAWLVRRAPLYAAALLLVEALLELVARPRVTARRPILAQLPANIVSPIDVVLPDGQVVADISVVSRIVAAANYAEFDTPTGTFLVRATLAELEQLLAPHAFVRVHRSVLVNWRSVQRLARKGRRINLHLRDGSVIAVGETYRDGLIPPKSDSSRRS